VARDRRLVPPRNPGDSTFQFRRCLSSRRFRAPPTPGCPLVPGRICEVRSVRSALSSRIETRRSTARTLRAGLRCDGNRWRPVIPGISSCDAIDWNWQVSYVLRTFCRLRKINNELAGGVTCLDRPTRGDTDRGCPSELQDQLRLSGLEPVATLKPRRRPPLSDGRCRQRHGRD
jgi:hypothetical protein